MFYIVTPNAAVNADNIDCVKWEESFEPLLNTKVPVAYVSFESGKKEKLVGPDATVLRSKFERMAKGEIRQVVRPYSPEGHLLDNVN